MKNILLPTDFSENSWNATVYALKLYTEEECVFYIINSSELKVTATINMSKKLFETMHKRDKEQLLHFKQRIESTYPNPKHEVSVLLSSEDLFEAIDTAIKSYDIDLVVMATKGATGVEALVLGSNTVKIINKIKKCPVLVIPDNCSFVAPQQVAFPTDFSRFFTHKELRPMLDIVAMYDANIRVLYVAEESQLSQEQKLNKSILKEHLIDNKSSFHWAMSYLKVAKEITAYIEDYNIDILVMIKYKHSYFESILREPIIKKIGFHITIPFLVVPK